MKTRIKKYIEGELIDSWVEDGEFVEVANKFEEMLNRIGYFTESGMRDDYCFIVCNTGDNCLKFSNED